MKTMLFIFSLTCLAFAILLSCLDGSPRDDTDSPGSRSGLRLHVDARTGCHYLSRHGSGLAPRLQADGRQLCEVPR